ncbi:hypothetical protein niasHT_005228 [Heterodera trifolii]|uniref:Amidinotransferase n=1 Tax=Heterodera trifolii TaxID=157864 RepID=A0ABD2LTN2_9BILA
MCRPTHFNVKYEINPWMRPGDPVNVQKATDQWEGLKRTLEESGAQVEVMEPVGADNYPDLVFTANAAVVRGKNALLSNFFYPERKGEQHFYDRWFKQNGYETFKDLHVPFEGAGDALWIGKSKLFCGIGPRTDVRALTLISEKLRDYGAPFKIYGFRLIDPRFYHIDTCFCPLNDQIAIYYPYAFDPVARHNMSNEVELVPVHEEDAMRFACNSIVIGKTVIINSGTEHTASMVQKLGFTVKFVDMSEFMKSGGAAKCCTLQL